MRQQQRQFNDARACADFIHGRITGYFPFNSCMGWEYRGFGLADCNGDVFVVLKFEREIGGRKAWAKLEIAPASFDANLFDLRGWIIAELEKQSIDRAVEHEKQLH